MPEASWSEIVAAAYNVYALSEGLGVGLGVLVADNDWLSHALSKLLGSIGVCIGKRCNLRDALLHEAFCRGSHPRSLSA